VAMSRAGIPNLTAWQLANKRTKNDFFLSQIPANEVRRAANGRWICSLCQIHLDTLEVLFIHRNGKKHQLRVESYYSSKEQQKPEPPKTLFSPRVLKRNRGIEDHTSNKKLKINDTENLKPSLPNPQTLPASQNYEYDQDPDQVAIDNPSRSDYIYLEEHPKSNYINYLQDWNNLEDEHQQHEVSDYNNVGSPTTLNNNCSKSHHPSILREKAWSIN